MYNVQYCACNGNITYRSAEKKLRILRSPARIVEFKQEIVKFEAFDTSQSSCLT